MTNKIQTLAASPAGKAAGGTVMAILVAISFSHLLNDMMQSLIFALYPMLKVEHHLSFAQIGLITLTYQITASLLQPVVGLYTDKRPQPYSLAVGMACTLGGLLLLSKADSMPSLLLASAMVGMGSSIFHPESSRVARMASGGRHGLAQSVFQVGGNLGTSLGPLLAAWIILPRGQGSVAWFGAAALVGMLVLTAVGNWYRHHQRAQAKKPAVARPDNGLSRVRVLWSLFILAMLIFSKYFYLASLTSYYTFYLISKFHLSVQSAQMHLFLFLFAVAAGTLIGGPVGDRIGRKRVIWGSILGVAPFTLLMPYVGLMGTEILSVVIGLVLASAFSAILIYAQELVPGKVGAISGLFFGFAFGMGGLGAAALGTLADHTSIFFVYKVCAFLPLLGLLTALLPDLHARRRAPTANLVADSR
ncbi:MAG: MFS transporter [Paludibacterium sp.]|uniref:MFS transporter n=1 Tax=Paludibacterium sp. TaxID=1917523 RepID=UPI0025EF1C70|nr:MFS transporter [Paludibacterium sp.]MBV8046947.1 MFS transporter [Paludibacterium sp.]MBV8646540.1 MFS transporter [Paludibacterium sp.]